MSKDDTGFKSYEYKGLQLDPCDHATDSLIYMLNSQRIYFPEWDIRRMVKKPTRTQKLKRYLSHVWYALKGGRV